MAPSGWWKPQSQEQEERYKAAASPSSQPEPEEHLAFWNRPFQLNSGPLGAGAALQLHPLQRSRRGPSGPPPPFQSPSVPPVNLTVT